MRVTRVNGKRSSPMMMGRILVKSSNKKELFIPNMGTSVIISLMNIAKHNGWWVVWTPFDAYQASYIGVNRIELNILRQANLWMIFENIKGGHSVQVLIARQEAEEILIA